MVKRVKSFMEKWKMAGKGDRILAGVSGGADSVCLFLILKELAQEQGFSLEVIHVEHGIRGEESCRDAQFVRNLCEKTGVVCHEAAVNVPEYAKVHHVGEEEAARILRYGEFEKYASLIPGTKIALAHHMEDNAETMLLQLIRGTGLDGLCGMRPVRGGECGEVYIRPLLEITRGEIESFLSDRGQDFCKDSSNLDLAYSRNRIRHQVIPELMRINPQAVRHMNQTAERLAKVRDWADLQTDMCQGQVIRREGDRISMSVNALGKQPEAIRIRLIHQAVSMAAGAKKDIAAVHLEAVESLLGKQTGRRVDLPCGLMAKREYESIILGTVEADAPQTVFEVTEQQLNEWRRDGEKVCFAISPQGGEFTFRFFQFQGDMEEIPRKMYTKWFDYDMIKKGFSIRTRKPKDYFVLDAAGHRKKIKDYFVNEKVPADQRDQRLLMAMGAKVLWIVGGRMGYGAGISEHTRTVLEITYQGGKCNGYQQES